MGKYKHEGKGRNISVSGGQERKDLFKDMSGGYNAMGDSNQPLYKYNGSVAQQRYSSATPLEGNAFGHAMQKAGGDYDKAKSMLEMKGHSSSPTYKKGCTSGSGSNAPYKKLGDPKSKLKNKINKLSDKHKKLFSAYDQGQEVDEGKLGRVENKLERKEKRYSKKYGSSPYSFTTPLNQNTCPEGKAWDDERKGCYPSKKEEAKMKTKKEGKLKTTMTKKMSKLPRKKVE